jgi:D-glycero-D-manno-heptose 1,7-bisphosphate phosphatase
MSDGLSANLDKDGVWREVFPQARCGGPALFLDRDGVVVEEVNYLSRVEDVAVIDGAVKAIAAANACGIPVILATNQAGIGRGYYGWGEFAAVQAAILGELGRTGARIDAVYACPHHPEALPPYRHPNHPARKPNPGMLLRAAAELNLDLGKSWLVGDKSADIEAARGASLAGALHVLTGHGAEQRAAVTVLEAPYLQVRLGRSIEDAIELIPLLARVQPTLPDKTSRTRRSTRR